MKNIIFDVDDTLYNLMEPFEKAHKELMAARTDADCEELFEASRTYSDEAFCMSREGKISEDEEFAYRVQKTYADVGVEVSKEEAKQFEERYRYYQKHIQVPEITKQILDHCKENYRIGILTNGTTKNQGKKLETLGLDHWFNPKTMFISDSIGAAKPDVKAFHTVQKEMKIDPEETWFIGDTFEIDVVGAAAVLMMTSPLLNVSNFISFAFSSPFKILAAILPVCFPNFTKSIPTQATHPNFTCSTSDPKTGIFNLFAF